MYWIIMGIGGVIYFIMLIIAESAKAPETPPKQKAEQWRMGCSALYFILLIFSGLFSLILDKERDGLFFLTICRITFWFLLAFIPVAFTVDKIKAIKEEKEEEVERLKREHELRRVREKEERERQAKHEKRERFKKNLIATGLFYEDDPWENLYDDVDNM